MTSLKVFQESLKRILVDPTLTESSLWEGNLPERLEIYRNNIRSNWIDTLSHDFPLTRLQFSDEAWADVETQYFARNPPRHWELNAAVASFPSFLRSLKIKPYVKELADYEWNDLQIFIDRSGVKPATAARTNPTVRLSVYQHQIFYWVDAGAPPEQPPLQKPEVLVFHRDRRNTCHIQEGDPLMLMLIEHFRKPGAALSELEPVRKRILPTNNIPLNVVFEKLKKVDLIL